MKNDTDRIIKELAIIILDWNGADDTEECLYTLRNFDLYDIYLLDNGSRESNTEKLREMLSREENKNISEECTLPLSDVGSKPIKFIYSEYNYGFAGGNNLIANSICKQYEYILLLNNDTYVPEGTIENMINSIKVHGCTVLTCDIRNYYDRRELWNAGGYFTIIGERKYFSKNHINRLKRIGVNYIDAEFITGCAMLIDCRQIREKGLFTDKFFHGEEDFNLCYKLKLDNKKVGVDLETVIYHKVGRTISRMSRSKRNYNGMLVNYVNRVIDFKEFYSHQRWIVWRALYISLLYIRRITRGMPLRDAALLCNRIMELSSKYDNVKKPVFDEIMRLHW